MISNQLSHQAYQSACQLFPGGVNSPVRAFKNVDSEPFFISKAHGSKITDLDQNTYIDYVLSWGPLILGHTPEKVKIAITEAINNGWTYGAPCELETQLALSVQKHFPAMEMMRFVSSGTEAAMGALRLARGVTGKSLIIKCDGGYHGHSDGLLVSAGSGLATLGTCSSSGVPDAFAKTTIVIPMNDVDALTRAFELYKDQIAAFILEPVAGNVGVILPDQGYLETCKKLCRQNEALLIFDEVMCGFRASKGGASQAFNISPDITILGKVVGGGFPVGAYGASKELMEHIAPCGNIYQAGTLSGNPVAMAAGLATITELDNGHFDIAEENTKNLVADIHRVLDRSGRPYTVNSIGTMFSLFLCEGPVRNYQDAGKTSKDVFSQFHRKMLEQGVYMAPSPFEASFMSSAHTRDDLDHTIDALEKTLSDLP